MKKVGRIRMVLAAVVVAGFMAALIALFFRAIPAANEQLLSYMLGQLSGFVAAIMAFNFGSSQGSEDKTAILSNRPTGQPEDPVHVEEGLPSPEFGK